MPVTLTATNWRGEEIDPQILIRAFGLQITPAAPGPAWRLAHIGYSHGRTQLRAVFAGTRPASGCRWLSNGGLNIWIDAQNGESRLDVNAGSYYAPDKAQGPWTVDPDGPSDIVKGVGLALGIQPQPTEQEDNRYLCPILYFEWDESTGQGVPPVQPVPPVPPRPGTSYLVSAAELEQIIGVATSLENMVRNLVNRQPVS